MCLQLTSIHIFVCWLVVEVDRLPIFPFQFLVRVKVLAMKKASCASYHTIGFYKTGPWKQGAYTVWSEKTNKIELLL